MKRLFYYKLSTCLSMLLMMSASTAIARQMDERGFPVQQQPESSFGFPSINTPSPAVTVTTPSTLIHQRPLYVVPPFYYFDYYGYPYYGYPYQDGTFYYSTSTDRQDNGNPLQPMPASSLPQGKWIAASNGDVPDRAIVYQADVANSTYYCRTKYQNVMYYGVLTPNAGCYIQIQSSIVRIKNYDVLVK